MQIEDNPMNLPVRVFHNVMQSLELVENTGLKTTPGLLCIRCTSKRKIFNSRCTINFEIELLCLAEGAFVQQSCFPFPRVLNKMFYS